MAKKLILNRLKVVLSETGRTSNYLCEKLDRTKTTVSRWCTNEVQPSLNTLHDISKVLKVPIKDLIWDEPIKR